MASNFFDLVSDSFFNPLTGANKRINYDLLSILNNKMSLNNLSATKDEMVEWIIDYAENSPIKFYNDETSEEEDSTRSLAYDKIRYFTRCGWLIEDYDNLKLTYSFDETGIKVLTAMNEAVKDDTKPLEFSGYVYNIYSSLYSFNFDHSVDICEQAFKQSQELSSMLRGLNVNIKKFLTKLLSENEAAPKEILSTIFFEYQKKVVLKAFKNFREKDNPSKYKLYIEHKINDLLEEESLNKMVNNYINVKNDGISNESNRKEAREFFITRFNSIAELFYEIEDYISMLDAKNTKYITAAESRLNFLLNEETDVEGRIIDCLKQISSTDDDFYEDDLFDLFQSSNIDEYSLYKPVNKKTPIKSVDLIEDFDDDIEEVEEKLAQLFKDNEFSVYKINEFVLNKLDGKKQIHAKDISLNSFDDFLKLFLTKIYEANSEVVYTIIKLDDKYKTLGYTLDDFIIERKD